MQTDIETQLLENLQELHKSLDEFSKRHFVVTSKFLYQLKQIVETTKLVVETTKIVTREIFMGTTTLRNELVQLAIEMVDAYRNVEKLMETLKYNITEESTPSVVMTSCQTIAMNATSILHIFTGSSFNRLYEEVQLILELLNQIDSTTITSYQTCTTISKVCVLLHSHLDHLISQEKLSTDKPHQLHALHHLLSEQFANFISAFDKYLVSGKSQEHEETVMKTQKEIINSLNTEIQIISPIHPLSSRPWTGTRLRAIKLLESEDYEGVTPILLASDFPNQRVLPTLDSLQTSVSSHDYTGAEYNKVELLEYFQTFEVGEKKRYQNDIQRQVTTKMLQSTLHKYESKYWKFTDKRDVGSSMSSLEEALVASNEEEDIVIQEIREIGNCLRYGTPNALYLLPKYAEKLMFLGAPKVTLSDPSSLLNAFSPESLAEAFTQLPPLPTIDALVSLQEMMIELIILDILITSTEYHPDQFAYFSQRVTRSVVKLSRSAFFLAYLVQNPMKREQALLAAKSLQQAISDISLFLNELVRVKAREEKDWVVVQDIIKFVRGVQVLSFLSNPPPVYKAYTLLTNIVNDATSLEVYRFANVASEVEFRIKLYFDEFKVCVNSANCSADLVPPTIVTELNCAIDQLSSNDIVQIGKEILKMMKKHYNGDLIRANLNIATIAAQSSASGIFDKTFEMIKESMKAFTLDEQLLFKSQKEEFYTRGKEVLREQKGIEELYYVSSLLRKALDNCFIVDEVKGTQASCRDARAAICEVLKCVVKLVVPPEDDSKRMYAKFDDLRKFMSINNWMDAIQSELIALFTIFHSDKDMKGRIFATLQLVELMLDFCATEHYKLGMLEDLKKSVAFELVYVKWGYQDIAEVGQTIGNLIDSYN
ncbi:hypothetical protein EIN_062730 [Entamoeba invadens IP1]|uniref:hypothetical protein n=1 Tax=Entamoeba invadens IP1 TaxID=370355 RepID=UPI0002C3F918|nr:hypothetical protein EIN_062730 [Entamoeba invadens IP1]ELP93578.1 hypothetical protein EIN_062730 [Entamoeba invadens IP1]|eukprot:XP_004260349.1 hypothetical protein EIN_062730 [Entamoeba invadens IP1]